MRQPQRLRQLRGQDGGVVVHADHGVYRKLFGEVDDLALRAPSIAEVQRHGRARCQTSQRLLAFGGHGDRHAEPFAPPAETLSPDTSWCA